MLEKRGQFYSFRYPYVYYFFLGKYFAENLSDIEIRDRVSRYSQHLYVRDYANTIVFLAHHSRDSFVYEQIVAVLKGLFSDKSELDFCGDTKSLAALVESAPRLVLAGGDVIEHRREVRAMQDEITEGSGRVETGDNDTEAEGETLPLFSKLTLLFKTVEILGQILKNQYATIPNNEKARLLEHAFSGPLRALKDFFEVVGTDTDMIVGEVERFIAEHESNISEEKRAKIARDAVFLMIVAISFGSLYKTASSVGSEHLRETISAVADKNDTVAFRLIELCVKLESQGGIPFSLITALKKRTKDNSFAYHILQRMAYHYLYMFKTKESDKQRLCAELGIPMATQRVIDLKTRDSKRDK